MANLVQKRSPSVWRDKVKCLGHNPTFSFFVFRPTQFPVAIPSSFNIGYCLLFLPSACFLVGSIYLF